MLYEVVYDAGTKIQMTKEQVQNFLMELQKKDVVEFDGEFLTKFFKVIAKKKHEVGRLHDGTKVIKQFGEWKDAQDPTLKLDRSYYPELVDDTVLTEEEYQERKLLNSGV